MHPEAADAIVASVRLRVSQGDCPTEAAQSTETIEDCLLTVAESRDRLARRVEALVLPVDQLNHALGWLHGSSTELADDALVKLTDAKGRAICTLTAKWLRALADLPQPERQAPTWDPSAALIPGERPR